VCVCICVFERVFICVYVFMSVLIYVCLCECACMHVCICMRACVCIYGGRQSQPRLRVGLYWSTCLHHECMHVRVRRQVHAAVAFICWVVLVNVSIL
jgi:hypothetical protein